MPKTENKQGSIVEGLLFELGARLLWEKRVGPASPRSALSSSSGFNLRGWMVPYGREGGARILIVQVFDGAGVEVYSSDGVPTKWTELEEWLKTKSPRPE